MASVKGERNCEYMQSIVLQVSLHLINSDSKGWLIERLNMSGFTKYTFVNVYILYVYNIDLLWGRNHDRHLLQAYYKQCLFVTYQSGWDFFLYYYWIWSVYSSGTLMASASCPVASKNKRTRNTEFACRVRGPRRFRTKAECSCWVRWKAGVD